ncbi:thioredoxin family protein [Chloroflexales bacterium ZM16-3]|nr:thioredoxin family protein [Chloroflexales bacterium ZM16-3]
MTTARTLRTSTLILMALLLIAALASCGQPAASSSPAVSPEPSSVLVPVLAVSELDVGPNRIALGLLQNGTPLNQADLKLGMRFFYLDGSEDTKVQSESSAVYRGQGLPFGLYVGYTTFDKPGNWSVELTIPNGATPQVVNLRLDVKPTSNIPAIGQPALPSKNLTVHDNPNLNEITSDTNPDPDFYQLTIADAIAAKKPFVIGFLTPGYCQTAVCGPNLTVLKKLKDEFKGKLNFIHVEVYPYPFGESFKALKRVEPMVEWGLLTEPWTFLVDANGIIQYRYEGGITFDEMEPALAQLAAGQPVTPLAAP